MASFNTLLVCLFVVVHTYAQTQEASDLEAYIDQARQNVNPRYRLSYHISPTVGWMNDPNGFSYYNGQYHLFYQYYPYDSAWGPMHWGHVVSDDLVNWETLPVALVPDEEMCYSGSAVVDGDTLYIVYTANIVTEIEPLYNQTQYLAYSTNGIDFQKYENNPVLVDPNQSPDFRDPKVWRNGDYWYSVIGSNTADGRGSVLLYRSLDLINWEFINVLAESQGDLGFMWECPDFFELNGKYVLVLSPEGISAQGDRFNNHQNVGYFVGSFDYDTHTFTPETDFQELDYGHDFYATQSLETDGRTLLVGWFSMWQRPYPEAEDGWTGALTLIRELTLDSNNRLLMSPINELASLRDEVIYNADLNVAGAVDLGTAVELIIEIDLEKNITLLLEGVDGGETVELRWDADTGNVVVERGDGDLRQVQWNPSQSRDWRIFLDTSSVELFCGDGEVVFSTRVYPLGGWRITSFSEDQELRATAYSLRRSVPV